MIFYDNYFILIGSELALLSDTATSFNVIGIQYDGKVLPGTDYINGAIDDAIITQAERDKLNKLEYIQTIVNPTEADVYAHNVYGKIDATANTIAQIYPTMPPTAIITKLDTIEEKHSFIRKAFDLSDKCRGIFMFNDIMLLTGEFPGGIACIDMLTNAPDLTLTEAIRTTIGTGDVVMAKQFNDALFILKAGQTLRVVDVIGAPHALDLFSDLKVFNVDFIDNYIYMVVSPGVAPTYIYKYDSTGTKIDTFATPDLAGNGIHGLLKIDDTFMLAAGRPASNRMFKINMTDGSIDSTFETNQSAISSLSTWTDGVIRLDNETIFIKGFAIINHDGTVSNKYDHIEDRYQIQIAFEYDSYRYIVTKERIIKLDPITVEILMVYPLEIPGLKTGPWIRIGSGYIFAESNTVLLYNNYLYYLDGATNLQNAIIERDLDTFKVSFKNVTAEERENAIKFVKLYESEYQALDLADEIDDNTMYIRLPDPIIEE